MPREEEKKHWEKGRRDRLKEAFMNLEKLLPSYDPSSAATRINVLMRSIEYIQEMQSKIEKLLKPNSKINAEVLQLRKLQDRIKRLVTRNELLSGLLREAKIPIPSQGSVLKNFKHVHKWSGKINEKTALLFQKKEKLKENEKENKNSKGENQSQPQRRARNKLNSSSLIPKHQKNIIDKSKPKASMTPAKKKFLQPATTNCLIIYTQATSTPPCYLVTNAPSKHFGSSLQTVITNTFAASNPLMSTNVKDSKKSVIEAVPKLSSLGTGTLVLTNGTLLPVVSQSQPFISAPVVLQLNNNSNTLINKSQLKENKKIMSEHAKTSKMASKGTTKDITCSSVDMPTILNSSNIQKVSSLVTSRIDVSNVLVNAANITAFKKIVPKVNGLIRPNRCLTKTTHINKFPIPALTSNYSTNISIPEIPKLAVTKKNAVKGKRIGDRPMSLVAFRKLRKLARKREAEQKEETAKKRRMEGSSSTNITMVKETIINENTTSDKNLSDLDGTKKNSSLENESNTAVNENDEVPEIPENNSKVTENIDDQKSAKNIEFKSSRNEQHSPTLSKKTTSSSENSVNSEVSTSSKKVHVSITSEECDEQKNISDTSTQVNEENKGKGSSANASFSVDMNKFNMTSSGGTVTNGFVNLDNPNSASSKIVQSMEGDDLKLIEDNQNVQQTENIEISTGKTETMGNCSEILVESHLNIKDHVRTESSAANTENVCNMNQEMKNLDLHLGHSELSNDIFASLQVPPGCQNPESTSPTAAFLLAFPLVSSLTGVKVTEVMDDDNPDSQRETPTLLQIGTMDTTKPSQSDSLTPNLLNLDNLSFFSSKDIYSGFYNSFEQHLNSLTAPSNYMNDLPKISDKFEIPIKPSKIDKIDGHLKADGTTENIQTDSSKDELDDQTTDQVQSNSYIVDNNRNLPSINNAQSNFCYNKKSVDPVPKNDDRNIQIPSKSADIFTQKSSNHPDTKKDNIQNTSALNGSVKIISSFGSEKDVIKNVENIHKHMNQNLFNIENQNMQSSQKKVDPNKNSTSEHGTSIHKTFSLNTFDNFHMKKQHAETLGVEGSISQNIFHFDSRCSQSSMQQKMEQNTNFHSEKHISVSHKNLVDRTIDVDKRNVQTTMQKNHSSHLPFMENRNFVPITSQPNFNHNLFNIDNNISDLIQKNEHCRNNYNVENRNTTALPKEIIRPYVIAENKDFQNIPAQKESNNTKTIRDRSNESLHKQTRYNNIATPSQKSADNNVSSSYNIDNRITGPSQKEMIRPYFTSESKDFQNIPAHKDANNIKNIHGVNIIDESTHKNVYHNINLENKNIVAPIQRKTDINFNFNLQNKVAPLMQKVGDSKEMLPSYSMTYTNMSYDLNSINKVCTCAYSSSKTFPDPLYTNSNNNNYNYYSNSENYLNESCFKNTKIDKNIGSDFENYTDFRKTDFSNAYYPDNNFQKNTVIPNKSENAQEKPTYNWMTTATKTSVDHIIPPFSKEDVLNSTQNLLSNNQTTYFNTTSMYTGEISTNLNQPLKKTFDLNLVNTNTNYQKNEMDENQFAWSPTKIPQFLEPAPSFVSSTLPTLVGDLALGTATFTDPKLELNSNNNRSSNKDVKSKATPKFSYENQNNFFSVSQLVHTNKEVAPAKPTRRRNSGSGSKTNQSKNKKVSKTNEEQKDVQQCFNKSPGQSQVKHDSKNLNCRQSSNIFSDSNKRNTVKVSSTNYSAEALIGHQGHSETISKRDHVYTGGTMKNMSVPPFIPDNIIPYFPPVDIQQDNYIQQNQNYQNFSHNFTTFPSSSYSTNTFIPACTITTPYLSTSTFMPDLPSGHEFSTENMTLFPNTATNKDHKFKNTTKTNSTSREEKNIQINQCSNNNAKKIKRKSSNENNLTPNFVDFSFLSVPGSINSPLLPEDFHSHASFLPPPTQPQLYPCKNPLYPPKQSNITSTAPLLPLPPIPPVTRTGIQHPEISPSLNSAGTSLTNFNLSTIFPEINKGSMNEIYADNRMKEQPVNRYYPNSSISFNSKPILTYPNCQPTQTYGIDSR